MKIRHLMVCIGVILLCIGCGVKSKNIDHTNDEHIEKQNSSVAEELDKGKLPNKSVVQNMLDDFDAWVACFVSVDSSVKIKGISEDMLIALSATAEVSNDRAVESWPAIGKYGMPESYIQTGSEEYFGKIVKMDNSKIYTYGQSGSIYYCKSESQNDSMWYFSCKPETIYGELVISSSISDLKRIGHDVYDATLIYDITNTEDGLIWSRYQITYTLKKDINSPYGYIVVDMNGHCLENPDEDKIVPDDYNVYYGECLPEVANSDLSSGNIQFDDMIFCFDGYLTVRDIYNQLDASSMVYSVSDERSGLLDAGESRSIDVSKDGITKFRFVALNPTEEIIRVEDAILTQWHTVPEEKYDYIGEYLPGGVGMDGQEFLYASIEDYLSGYDYEILSRGDNIDYKVEINMPKGEYGYTLEYHIYVSKSDGYINYMTARFTDWNYSGVKVRIVD